MATFYGSQLIKGLLKAKLVTSSDNNTGSHAGTIYSCNLTDA